MLDLYKNIRKKRLELGMSQDELAKKTGYKDRTSISKIEAGRVDLSQSKIKAFALALDTTTSELLGSDIQEGRKGRDKAMEDFMNGVYPYLSDPHNPESPAIRFVQSEDGISFSFRIRNDLDARESETLTKIAMDLCEETGLCFSYVVETDRETSEIGHNMQSVDE